MRINDKASTGAIREASESKNLITFGGNQNGFDISNHIENPEKIQCPKCKPPGATEGAVFRAPQSSRRDLLEQSKLAHLPFCFIGLRLVCDECAAPLHLYGENFIETYTEGRVNILRCLCDLHADELEVKK